MNARKSLLFTFALVAVLALLAACAAPAAAPQEAAPSGAAETGGGEAVTVKVLAMQQAGYTPDEMDEIAARFTADNPGIDVEVSYLSYDELYDKLVTSMSGAKPAYDVFLVDDIWYAQFASAGWLLDVTDRIPQDVHDSIFDAAWDITTVDGKIYGMPWMLDQEMFFYNTEMLEAAGYDAPPTTWEEMEEMGMKMKEMGLVEYPIIWSWAQAEASITDFVALLYGNGGEFFDENNQPAFNNERGVQTLAWMVDSIEKGITNPSSIASVEEDVRSVFSQGKAAFAMNWSYMYELAQFNEEESQVTGKVGLALMPVFEQGKAEGIVSSTIDGSMGFSIAANSDHTDAAWKYLEFLTSEPIQMEFSAHLPPAWKTAYEGDNLQKLLSENESNEALVPVFTEQFKYSHVRPKVTYYTEASTTLQLALQEALGGSKTPEEALNDAAAAIQEMAKQ